MKVFGIVIIIVGLIMVYIGITGNQHNLMATIKGSSTPIASGQSIKLGGTTTSKNSNNPPSNSSGGGGIAV